MCDTELIEDMYNENYGHHKTNRIHETAIIHANVKMGKNNVIGAYAVIGGNGEIRGAHQDNFRGTVEIGDNNIISELVTIQRPFNETVTKIGDGNLIMAHAHIGHDVVIGNDCEICTGVIVGGYSVIKDKAKLKLGVTVRNRKTIGSGAIVGLGAAVVKDVIDGDVVVGNPAKPIKKQ